jgi:predicted small lipoprotein YifL
MIFQVPRVLLATMLALAAAGCGLKGPLYSPDDKKETVGTPTTEPSNNKRRTPVPPAPQAQKKDAADAGVNPAPSSDTQSAPASPTDPDRPADAEPVPPPDR